MDCYLTFINSFFKQKDCKPAYLLCIGLYQTTFAEQDRVPILEKMVIEGQPVSHIHVVSMAGHCSKCSSSSRGAGIIYAL